LREPGTPLTRIEQALEKALCSAIDADSPPKLAAAVRYAVFPGGARIRPQLCLAVAAACGATDRDLCDGAATALELLHCASLVHDDLPCFDDAATRRGKVSLHRAFGERLAVLAGDALIVLAFDALAAGAHCSPQRLGALIGVVARGVGLPTGIAAGQAWECEPRVNLSDYQRAKTGALFAAATMAGAITAGADHKPWALLGDCLGEAYQVADDIRDVVADPQLLGKPVGRDVALGRPSAAAGELGLTGAIQRFDQLMLRTIAAIPRCPGEAHLRALVRMESQRLVPKDVSDSLGLEAIRIAA
jgi:geranylgeranyl diphosphate synthase, type II